MEVEESRVERRRGYTLLMPWAGHNAALLKRQVRTSGGYTEAIPSEDGAHVAYAMPKAAAKVGS